jgi:hypothetical protein
MASFKSPLARAVGTDVHGHEADIIEAAMKNLKQRDPDAVLVFSNATFADSVPVIRFELRANVESLGASYSFTTETIFAVWKSNEVWLECGYDTAIRQDKNVETMVRAEIDKIFRTLQFER